MALSKIARIVRDYVRKEATSPAEQMIADLESRNARFARNSPSARNAAAGITTRTRGFFPMIRSMAQRAGVAMPYPFGGASADTTRT